MNIWTQNPDLLVAQKEQLLGRTVHEMLSVQAAETIMAALHEAGENGSSYGKVICIDFPGGTKWFELSVSRKCCINGVDRHFMLLSRDITERKQIEETLRFIAQRGWLDSAETFFDALVRYLGESLGVAYVIIDRIAEGAATAETVAVYAKGATAPNMRYALKGTPCENVVGKQPCCYQQGVQQLFPEDTLLEEMGVESYVGIPLWDSVGHPIGLIAVLDSKPLLDEAPSIQLLQLVATRVASELEREQNDHTLRMREQEFRTLAENSPDNISRFDIHCRQIYLNPAMEKTFGLDPAWLLGKTPIEQATGDMPRDLGALYEQSIRQVIETGEPGELEMIMPNPAGGLETHLIRIVAERNAEGVIIGALAIGRDITAIKQAEEQLTLLSFALDHVGEAAYLIDEKACFHYVNEEACRALGYSRDELLARSIMDIDPDFATFNWPDLWSKIMYHGPLSFERRHKSADGHIFPVEIVTNYFEFAGQRLNLALARDITERKRAVQELQEREQQFRTLAENLPDNVARYDRNCLKVYVNPQLEKTLGRSAVSLVGLAPFDGHGEEFSGYQHTLEQVLADGQDTELDLIVLDAEKGERYHNIRFVAERDADGTVTGAMVIGRDITDRKLIEEALAAREQEFRTLADNSPDNINRYDIGCRYVYVNPQFEKTMGNAAGSSVLGKTPLELDSTEQTERYVEKIKWVFETGKGADFDAILPDTGEGERHHNIRLVAERGPNNEVTGVLALGRDVTERMRMEILLQKKGQMLEEAQRIAHVGSWELELANNHLIWSDEACRIFEITPGQSGVSYETFQDRIHPDDREMVKQAYTTSLLNRTPYDIDHRLLFSDGRVKYVHERCETYYDNNGTPLRSLGMVQDITEQRLAEETLRTKQQKLAELELELSLAEEQERQRVATVLHDHIGQLLLMARIKLGTLQSSPVAQTAGDVRSLVDEAIQSTRSLTVQLCPPILSTLGLEAALELLCRQMLEEWELEVTFSDDQQPKPLQSELRTVLYQTARELLINVGKHAGTRQARLAISRENALFVMTVTDNGAGFDPDSLTAASRQAKGFGLFNVRRRIRNMGGEMIIDSSPLQGTWITITLPLLVEGEGV